MRRNHAVGGVWTVRFASRWQYCEYKERVGNAMHRGGLRKRSAHRWHGLAAILTVMTM
jgi:hypothetical protein